MPYLLATSHCIENVFKHSYTKFEIIKFKKVKRPLLPGALLNLSDALTFLPRAVQQLRLLHRVDMTSHFLCPKVGTKSNFTPLANK